MYKFKLGLNENYMQILMKVKLEITVLKIR